MEQVFADVWHAEAPRDAPVRRLARVWWWALRDTLARAPAERINAMGGSRWLALLAVAAVLGLGIGLVDSSPRWDDTGITVGVLLLTTGVLGLVHPRHAWVWAVAVGGWVPVLNVIHGHGAASLAALAFAFVGAYAGALGRRLVAPQRSS